MVGSGGELNGMRIELTSGSEGVNPAATAAMIVEMDRRRDLLMLSACYSHLSWGCFPMAPTIRPRSIDRWYLFVEKDPGLVRCSVCSGGYKTDWSRERGLRLGARKAATDKEK